ncbi:unnamed protein product, partial [marine sediment metagenome]
NRKYIIENTFGSINQDIWDSLPDGNIVINFYANDSLGNIGIIILVVIKSLPSTTTISGYNLFILLICSLTLISFFRYKKIKKT